jgi:hypothetical protein
VIRQTVAHVDLGAIEANFRAIAAFLSDSPPSDLASPSSDLASPSSVVSSPSSVVSSPPSVLRPPSSAPRIIAVVKANAYGHGASDVGLALERAGAAMLACADIEEGIVLRRAGVNIPILVFGALGISDLDGVFEYGLTPTISTPSAADNLARAAARVRPGSNRGQTGLRPASDGAQTGVKPGSDGGQTGLRPPFDRMGTQILRQSAGQRTLTRSAGRSTRISSPRSSPAAVLNPNP